MCDVIVINLELGEKVVKQLWLVDWGFCSDKVASRRYREFVTVLSSGSCLKSQFFTVVTV